MEAPKIHLSSAETELMKDAAVILTKNTIMAKMKALLQAVEQRQLEASSCCTDAVFATGPKISRGENYLGLPYLVLDYPRLSAGDDLFFARTMFWWGRFFSSTLHLSGRQAEARRAGIAASYAELSDYFLGIGEDPWAHHFEASNYKQISTWSASGFEALLYRPQLKLARPLPLEAWPQAEELLFARWKELLSIAGVALD